MINRYSLPKGLLLLLLLLASLLPTFGYTATTPNLTVQVIDGSKADVPIANSDVHVREILTDGSSVWRTVTKTNASGQVAFALTGLGNGNRYVLQAKNTQTGKLKQSAIIDKAGAFTFRVGNPLLNVTVTDALTKKALVDVSVTAYRQEAGKAIWVDNVKTTSTGLAVFDIDNLSTTNPISLSAKVFKPLSDQNLQDTIRPMLGVATISGLFSKSMPSC